MILYVQIYLYIYICLLSMIAASPKQIYLNLSWHLFKAVFLSQGHAQGTVSKVWGKFSLSQLGSILASSGQRPGLLITSYNVQDSLPQHITQPRMPVVPRQRKPDLRNACRLQQYRNCTVLHGYTCTGVKFLKDQCIANDFLINDRLLEL